MTPIDTYVEQIRSKKHALTRLQHELDTLQEQITTQYNGTLPAAIAEVLLDLPEDCPGWGHYHPKRTLCLVCAYNIACVKVHVDTLKQTR